MSPEEESGSAEGSQASRAEVGPRVQGIGDCSLREKWDDNFKN